jgi:hypothetical protein
VVLEIQRADANPRLAADENTARKKQQEWSG